MQTAQSQPQWWQSGVIYQVYPRSFADSNGDGIGDLNGIRSKLAYLKWLGVDAVWLSPIFPSPMADFGYDISDYSDVEPMFGTLADFDALLAETHRLGLKLLLDLVPNHTSDEHAWFQESRSSRDNSKRDWYIWRDPAPDGGVPNNWLSQFGGSAWQLDEATGQYYLHSYDVKQADLNWRNPAVREAVYAAMRFWFDRGVDGFRIDAFDRVVKDAQFRNNPTNPSWKPGDQEAFQLLELYSNDQPEAHDIMREMRQLADTYHDRVLIGEIYLPYDRLMGYYGPNLDEAHLPFNFKLVMLPQWQALSVADIVNEYESVLPTGAWPNWVLGNHDRTRLVSRVGVAQARLAQMLLLTLRGTPTLYYGDELGMHNIPIAQEQIVDPWGKFDPQFNRDPVRTPMQWDVSPQSGFCPSDVTPWLPVAEDYPQFNVAVEQTEPASMLGLVRSLLDLRRAEPALHFGNYQSVKTGSENCFGYLRVLYGQTFLIVLNFSNQPQTLALPQFEQGQVALSTYLDRTGAVELTKLELRGDEGLVIKL